MKIIYSSVLCSEQKYGELFSKSKIMPGQQVQKYHRLIVEGLEKNNIEVETISAIPISRKTNKKLFFKKEKEKIGQIKFNYLPLINLPIIKNIGVFISGFIETSKLLKEEKNNIIICDILNISVAASSLLASKIFSRKSVGIVTDVPGYLADNTNGKESFIKLILKQLLTKINVFIMNRFDSYIFLTDQTNDLINKKNKPYIVIEGQVDIEMKNIDNKLENKYKNKVIMYTGSIKKIYGMKMLIEGFLEADVSDSELHIYGEGNFERELKEITDRHCNIKFFGTHPNNFIIKEQLKATLLVNPRPSNEEYTKYSFPSKNMEYMVSGTPVLTTFLPGMPDEYKNYVYLIKEETVNGVSSMLEEVLNKSNNDLNIMGKEAKKFVLREKNNLVQAKKIIEMIDSNYV